MVDFVTMHHIKDGPVEMTSVNAEEARRHPHEWRDEAWPKADADEHSDDEHPEHAKKRGRKAKHADGEGEGDHPPLPIS